jgi:hypothetical protein
MRAANSRMSAFLIVCGSTTHGAHRQLGRGLPLDTTTPPDE